jgi:hypothetical protein
LFLSFSFFLIFNSLIVDELMTGEAGFGSIFRNWESLMKRHQGAQKLEVKKWLFLFLKHVCMIDMIPTC